MTRIYCHHCRKVTDWTDMRGGRSERCSGCRDVFPCRVDCDHADCVARRAELVEKKRPPTGGVAP